MIKLLSLSAVALSLTGCASVMNDVTHPIKIETVNLTGKVVTDVSCKLDNDMASQTVTAPGIANVRRSSKDMQISCTKAGEPDGRAALVSRANGGLAGNILIGGGIGAIVDHNRGTAYTYPQWVRVVMGRFLTFDRRADVEGAVNLGAEAPTANK